MNIELSEIIQLYEYFYRDYTGIKNFKFNITQGNIKHVKNFRSMLTYSHGYDWLFDYFCFQFQRRSTQTIKADFMHGKVKMMISWIIGQKAFESYKKASDEEKFYGHEYKRIRGLKNPFVEKKVLDKQIFENNERRRFYNTELGFIHCTDLNLFSGSNKYCLGCKNRTLCIM
jgi:hypothetical protein